MSRSRSKQRVRDWARDVWGRNEISPTGAHVTAEGESKGIAREVAPKLGVLAIISLAITLVQIAWKLWQLWNRNPNATEAEEDEILSALDPWAVELVG